MKEGNIWQKPKPALTYAISAVRIGDSNEYFWK